MKKSDNFADKHRSQKIIDPVCSKCDSWYPEIGNQGTGDVIENG